MVLLGSADAVGGGLRILLGGGEVCRSDAILGGRGGGFELGLLGRAGGIGDGAAAEGLGAGIAVAGVKAGAGGADQAVQGMLEMDMHHGDVRLGGGHAGMSLADRKFGRQVGQGGSGNKGRGAGEQEQFLHGGLSSIWIWQKIVAHGLSHAPQSLLQIRAVTSRHAYQILARLRRSAWASGPVAGTSFSSLSCLMTVPLKVRPP